MPTADEDCGNACGYVEEITVVGGTAIHQPRKSTEKPITQANSGVVQTRKYCVLRAGHGGGHSYRTQ